MADPSRGPTVLPTTSVAELKATLLDRSLPLFTRYRAMFSLRNLPPSEASVLALAEGFKDPSALFRHEIAYVFGQLTSKYSVPALIERLRCAEEGEMVRHECAEALGGIASEGEGASASKSPISLARSGGLADPAPLPRSRSSPPPQTRPSCPCCASCRPT
jgi:deoxyhypusine monooxygenase